MVNGLSMSIASSYPRTNLFWRDSDQLRYDATVEPLDTSFVCVDLLHAVPRVPVEHLPHNVAPLIL